MILRYPSSPPLLTENDTPFRNSYDTLESMGSFSLMICDLLGILPILIFYFRLRYWVKIGIALVAGNGVLLIPAWIVAISPSLGNSSYMSLWGSNLVQWSYWAAVSYSSPWLLDLAWRLCFWILKRRANHPYTFDFVQRMDGLRVPLLRTLTFLIILIAFDNFQLSSNLVTVCNLTDTTVPTDCPLAVLRTVLVCLVWICFLLFLKCILIISISHNFHETAYRERLEKNRFAILVMETLQLHVLTAVNSSVGNPSPSSTSPIKSSSGSGSPSSKTGDIKPLKSSLKSPPEILSKSLSSQSDKLNISFPDFKIDTRTGGPNTFNDELTPGDDEDNDDNEENDDASPPERHGSAEIPKINVLEPIEEKPNEVVSFPIHNEVFQELKDTLENSKNAKYLSSNKTEAEQYRQEALEERMKPTTTSGATNTNKNVSFKTTTTTPTKEASPEEDPAKKTKLGVVSLGLKSPRKMANQILSKNFWFHNQEREKRTMKEVKKLATLIFNRLLEEKRQNNFYHFNSPGNSSNSTTGPIDYLVARDFEALFNEGDDSINNNNNDNDSASLRNGNAGEAGTTANRAIQLADRAFTLFDPSGCGKVYMVGFRDGFQNLYRESINLSKSLYDTNAALSKLDTMATVFTLFISIFVCLGAFQVNVQSLLTLSLSIFIGLAVVIGPTLKNSFESAVLIFFLHPYDVGDKVNIDGVVYTVYNIYFMTTVFKRWDGQICYMHNFNLTTKSIVNMKRSSDPPLMKMEMIINALAVSGEQLDALYHRLYYGFLKENGQDYFNKLEFNIVSVGSSGNIPVHSATASPANGTTTAISGAGLLGQLINEAVSQGSNSNNANSKQPLPSPAAAYSSPPRIVDQCAWLDPTIRISICYQPKSTKARAATSLALLPDNYFSNNGSKASSINANNTENSEHNSVRSNVLSSVKLGNNIANGGVQKIARVLAFEQAVAEACKAEGIAVIAYLGTNSSNSS